jgi:hypothetical protein
MFGKLSRTQRQMEDFVISCCAQATDYLEINCCNQISLTEGF